MTIKRSLPTLKKFTLSTSLVAIAIMAGIASVQTHAAVKPVFTKQEDGTYGLKVGLNVQYANGGYDTDKDVMVLPSIFYDNGRVYARGSQLGIYAINNDTSELSAYFQPGGPRFENKDANGSLALLSDRDWSGMLGLSYMYKSPIGGFRGQVATDTFDNSDGTTAKLTYLAKINANKWTIYPSAGVEWVDEKYNDYYYGVSAKDSVETGVPAYDPDASFSPFINVSAMYDINDDWGIFLGQDLAYLSSEQGDSPMSDGRTTYSTTIGFTHNF